MLGAVLSITGSFILRMTDTVAGSSLPSTAVVFTGQFDRIQRALDLLQEGRVSRVFISGVNVGAGLNPATFAAQFELSGSLSYAIEDGRIILGTEAQDTKGNACEAASWLATEAATPEVLLITTLSHMPRASLALESRLPSSISVERMSVDEIAPGVIAAEAVKFVATLATTFLPAEVLFGSRSSACPNQ